jgi:hypothetical protein
MEDLLRESQVPLQWCGRHKVVDVRDLDARVDRDHQSNHYGGRMRKSASFVPANELFLTDIPTAAQRMSTTVFAIRELCRSGEFKHVPIGHAWLISPGAIQDFIRREEQGRGSSRPGPLGG